MSSKRISRLPLALCLLPALLLGACSEQSSSRPPALSAQACAVWNASTAYMAGNTVTYNSVFYKANWWTQGDVPATHNGGSGSGQPWTVTSTCGGGTTPTPTPTPAPTPTPTPAPAPTPTPTPAPTPAPTPTPTPTPSPTPGLAKHALVGYWHNFTNPSGNTFPLGQVSGDWDVIVVAFADNAGNGNVSFTLDPNAGGEAQFISDISAKHAQGKKVVLSLGGQNGTVSVGSQAEADNFATSLAAILRKYGFDGIDLDLESGVSQGAAIQTYLPVAVKSLRSKMGGSLYLSMAPEWPYVEGGYTSYGSIWGAYIPIINALRSELTVLHPQYYNNGDVYTPYSASALKAGSRDQLVATARMLIEGFTYGGNQFAGLRPDQVAFGVPSGPSSANSGFTTTADVTGALDCLTQLVNCGSIRPNAAYPTFRGVMTWSVNWDRHDGFPFSRPVASKLHSLP